MGRVNRGYIVDLIHGNGQPDEANLNVRGHKDVIGWKGGFYIKHDIKTGMYEYMPVLIKLLIPKCAFRTSYSNPDHEKYSKHRCSEAKVLGFYSYYTGREIKDLDRAYSFFGRKEEPIIVNNSKAVTCTFKTIYFEYIKNITALPDNYDCGLRVCSHGVHYFYEKQSALLYLDQEIIRWYMKPRHNSGAYANLNYVMWLRNQKTIKKP